MRSISAFIACVFLLAASAAVADSRVFKGQLLIIKVYCPDELDDFQEFIDSLKFDDDLADG
jgi:hypothetical protein